MFFHKTKIKFFQNKDHSKLLQYGEIHKFKTTSNWLFLHLKFCSNFLKKTDTKIKPEFESNLLYYVIPLMPFFWIDDLLQTIVVVDYLLLKFDFQRISNRKKKWKRFQSKKCNISRNPTLDDTWLEFSKNVWQIKFWNSRTIEI